MSKNERKIIYLLLSVIIILSLILLYKIKNEPKYNKELYDEIYKEYEQLLTYNEENINKDDSSYNKEKIYMYYNGNGNNFRVIGQISIPKINISYPIIYETTEEYLKIAPTKLCGPEINAVGNLCIIGHNYRNNQFFSNLSKLENGDKVFIVNGEGEQFIYVVYDKYTILETDLTCTNQETNGKKEVTLITCTKTQKERLVVKCINIV